MGLACAGGRGGHRGLVGVQHGAVQELGLQGPDTDHAYELAGPPDGGLRRVAQAHSPASGRTLDVWTTEPVMQVYTAGALGTGATPDIGKDGVLHRPRAGLCLEPQQYPNAVNCASFPLMRVAVGQPYRARTEYRFGTRD